MEESLMKDLTRYAPKMTDPYAENNIVQVIHKKKFLLTLIFFTPERVYFKIDGLTFSLF